MANVSAKMKKISKNKQMWNLRMKDHKKTRIRILSIYKYSKFRGYIEWTHYNKESINDLLMNMKYFGYNDMIALIPNKDTSLKLIGNYSKNLYYIYDQSRESIHYVRKDKSFFIKNFTFNTPKKTYNMSGYAVPYETRLGNEYRIYDPENKMTKDDTYYSLYNYNSTIYLPYKNHTI